jgi:hypothetical protein
VKWGWLNRFHGLEALSARTNARRPDDRAPAMRRDGLLLPRGYRGNRESWATLRRWVSSTCRPDEPGLSGRLDQMGSRGAGFCRAQEVMCFSKVLRTLSSRGSTSVACPTRVTLATLSPAWLRSTLARPICDP